jgi:hypothetical protein
LSQRQTREVSLQRRLDLGNEEGVIVNRLDEHSGLAGNPTLRHGVQISRGIRHVFDAIPMLPCVGHGVRHSIRGSIRAAQWNQSAPQSRLDLEKEGRERVTPLAMR